jgi:hypothetical protein
MSESAGLTLISTQVQAATGFSSSNVDIADWKLLNSGKSDHYAIIRPGPTERPQLTMRTVDNRYRTVIEVWQRYKDDGTTLTSLLGYVDAITARLDPRRKLVDTTGTIRDANITGYSEVTEQWNKDGGPSWLKRDILLDWLEEEVITYVE